MAGKSKAARAGGVAFGAVLIAAAVYGVFLMDFDVDIPEPPPPVRPLKTMTIDSPFDPSGRRFPGKVRASQEVDLAFQVAGPLVEFPVRKGQEVGEGELLGRLDPRDFQLALDDAEARLDEAETLWERMQRLHDAGNAQQVEYEEQKRAYTVAHAAAKQARKDLEDTQLRAPFAGVIASTFVENFENVQAKQAILSLQDVESVEIVVNVPESRVMQGKGEPGEYRHVATFEYLPDREFEVEIKEFEIEADPATQTYAATFVMPAPKDVMILPGMTATIREYRRETEAATNAGYAVPIDAVPVDSQGQYYVWKIEDAEKGMGTAHRANVTVGDLMRDDILVLDGLTRGDRIALAGVHLLQEGQKVHPFSAKGEDSP